MYLSVYELANALIVDTYSTPIFHSKLTKASHALA